MNLKGTSVVTVIVGDGDYVASVVDGRLSVDHSLVPPESFCYAVRGDVAKIFKIGEDHIATVAGWGDYCKMAIEKIRNIYNENTHGLSMKEIVEEAQHFCVQKWEVDPDGGVDKEFPATVVVYGLDGEYILSTNPERVECLTGILVESDSEDMNGKKVKIVHHGHGGVFAGTHMLAISRRISPLPIKTMLCMMEAMAASGIQDPPTGGYFLGATLYRTEGRPSATIYNDKQMRPHLSRVVAGRFEYLEQYLRFSLVVMSRESYFENPNGEGEIEKKLKDMFLRDFPEGEKLVSITLVGVRKGKMTVRVVKFSSPEARTIAKPLLTNMGLEYYLPSQEIFENLAREFVDHQDCL